MRFKRKYADSDALIHAVRQANGPLEELTALLRTTLPLMQRLEMADSSAYRDYEEALHILERLQHTNEDLLSRAAEETAPAPAQKTGEEVPAPGLAAGETPPAQQAAGAASAPRTAAPPDSALSRRVQLLFDRSASLESAEESAPVFSLFGSRRRTPVREILPVFRRPEPEAAGAAHPPEPPAAPESPIPLLSATGPDAPPVPPMYKMQFTAVAPGSLPRGGDSVLHLFMTEKDLPLAVEELLQQDPDGSRQAQHGVVVRVTMQSPDLELTRNTLAQAWPGGYLRFDFAFVLPEGYLKRQVLFNAVVYINEVIATRLKFLVNCAAPDTQIILPRRRDVLSAFLSYAGEDRARAAAILQGMQNARPDLHVCSDVETLRNGENWQELLPLEIARRDVFFLCWSHYARDSFWVNWEWNCALKAKGASCIEPIPLESPDRCPPPRDLDGRHFNDHLLYLMNAMQNSI